MTEVLVLRARIKLATHGFSGWGSEPILRKIREVYGDQVAISFKMGGLVEDINTFYDALNQLGGSAEQMAEQVRVHWQEASGRHGMPVDTQTAGDSIREMISTYPACIACKAAQLPGQELGDRFIRRMREGAAAEGKLIHRKNVQAALARELGLDLDASLIALEDGSAERAFREDLTEARGQGITGFPTFIIRNSRGQGTILQGYRSFHVFERVLDSLVEGGLQKNTIIPGKERTREFVDKYGKVATKEVAELFDISLEQAEQWLESLSSERSVAKVKAATVSSGCPGRHAGNLRLGIPDPTTHAARQLRR